METELEHIEHMLKKAKKHDFEIEVIWSALRFVQKGASIPEACIEALEDWDIQ